MRECFEIVVQGLRLRGVAHPPEPRTARAAGLEGLGVILLHPGFLPRSAQGDTAVALCDGLARQGIVAIRIDMPGLGDSEGDLPDDSYTFIDDVQEGGLAEVADECIEQIRERFGLQRVLIGGLCGAAITGFYSLLLRRPPWIAGVLALDTIFYLVRPADALATAAPGALAQPDWKSRKELLRNEIRLALLNSRLGGPLQNAAQRLRKLVHRPGARPEPAPPTATPQPAATETPAPWPAETNFKLVECVEGFLATDLPILFVTARDPNRPPEFDYTGSLLARQPGRAAHETITGTDHGFISGNGKPRLVECVSRWITNEFSQPPVAARAA
jgi:pimeloyl-ACP methyl ester carboxylesterase